MRLRLLALLLCTTLLPAQEIPAPLMAGILKSVAKLAGSPGRIATTHPEMKAELKKLGVQVVATAPMAYATHEEDVKALAAEKKLVICDKLDLMRKGAAIAVVEEDGKSTIYLHTRNLRASGVRLPDASLKLFYQIIKD